MTTSAQPGSPLDLVSAARAAGVEDVRLLEAIAAVPRAEFVPRDLAVHAYHDRPLPIPHAQVTTQPSLVAGMVAALELSSSDRVLEIGTGFGWQTSSGFTASTALHREARTRRRHDARARRRRTTHP